MPKSKTSRYQPRASSKPGPRVPGTPKPKGKVQKDAPAFLFTGSVPALKRPGPLSAEKVAKLQALYVAGAIPGVEKKSKAGFDLGEIMKLYAKYGPVLEMLIELYKSKFKKTDKPVPDTGGEKPTPEEPDLSDGEPSVPAVRQAVDFGQNVHWITRKKSMEPNTGRKQLSDGEKIEIWKGSTPAMQGDRVCVDCTPRDAKGKPFLPGQAENKTITWQHEALGIGELQLQEDVDFTPIFLVPWIGLEMDQTYEAGIRSTMLVNGVPVKTREHMIRVHTRGLD